MKLVKKSLLALAVAPVFALLAPAAAHAQVVDTSTVIVSPSARVCVTAFGGYRMRAEGIVPSGNPGFSFTVSANGQTIYPLSLSGTGYAAQLSSTYYPQYFPATFKFCATNLNTGHNAKVQLRLLTDADAPG